VSASRSEAPPLAVELDEATIRAWSRRTRAARGLGPKITDPATIGRIVVLALGPGLPNGGNDDGATPRHQGRGAASAGSASTATKRKRGARPNSKGPGLTNRDLRKTTPRTTEKVVAS
jgi:hypothetical protein